MNRVLTADRGDAGRRLDHVLRRHLVDVAMATRTRVQTWIEMGQVSVNGTPVRRVSSRAVLGDVVTVMLPDVAARPAMAPEDMTLDVLYEDEHLIAINKPAGVVVHPTYTHMDGTVMNALLWRARGWPASQRPSIVGRLDKLTSGIVIVAKSGAVHAALQRTLAPPVGTSVGRPPARPSLGRSNDSEKDYLAVVFGRVKVSRGEIDLRLARDRGDRRRVVASDTVGVPSLTRFERLAQVQAPRAGLALLRCRLVTGRTHQIRVHLAARGWPIVGDPVYGEARSSQVVDRVLAAALAAFPRQALHAWRVVFTHPITGERLTLEAPVPRDIEALLAASGLAASSQPLSRAPADALPFGSRSPVPTVRR